MGVRLYTPTLGRFLSVDPVEGGSSNDYDYADADPVNGLDLDGRWSWKRTGRWLKRNKWNIALTAASFVPGVGQAAWAYRGYRAARALGAIGRSCRVNSFTPETEVVMADGTTERIADVDIGDLVLARDEQSGETSPRRVDDVIVGQGLKQLVELTFDGDDEAVTATAGHPFYVLNEGWVDAGHLMVGARIASLTGSAGTVTDRRQLLVQDSVVYNLTVAGYHTYFVATARADVLVHNCSRKITGWSGHALRRLKKFSLSRQQVEAAFHGGRHRGPGRHPGSVVHVRGNIWASVDRRGCVITCGKVHH
jgi:hypothetical protein